MLPLLILNNKTNDSKCNAATIDPRKRLIIENQGIFTALFLNLLFKLGNRLFRKAFPLKAS